MDNGAPAEPLRGILRDTGRKPCRCLLWHAALACSKNTRQEILLDLVKQFPSLLNETDGEAPPELVKYSTGVEAGVFSWFRCMGGLMSGASATVQTVIVVDHMPATWFSDHCIPLVGLRSAQHNDSNHRWLMTRRQGREVEKRVPLSCLAAVCGMGLAGPGGPGAVVNPRCRFEAALRASSA